MNRLSIDKHSVQVDLRHTIEDEHQRAGFEWVTFSLERVAITESFVVGNASVTVKASIRRSDTGEVHLFERTSQSGLVDAFFGAVIHPLKEEFRSLAGISFTSFAMRGKKEVASLFGSDALAVAEVGVVNSRGLGLHFFVEYVSILGAGLDAVLYAIEFFVNAELAYRHLRDARAKLRNDTERSEEIAQRMADLVRITDYSAIARNS